MTGNATTPMIAGISSGTCQSQRSVSRSAIAITAAQMATTTHARAGWEALRASPILPIPLIRPLLNSSCSDKPASAAIWTITMIAAVTAHTTDSRSTSRCTRNAVASMTPSSSGRAVMRIRTTPPRHPAPAMAAVKLPTATATVVEMMGARNTIAYTATAAASAA